MTTSSQDLLLTVNEAPADQPEDAAATPVQKLAEHIQKSTDEIVELKLDKYALGPWSISKLKMLRKCPLQFYLKYILKTKVPDDVSGREDTTSADVGSAAHLILEHVMSGRSVREGYKLARKEYGPEKLSEEIWQDRVETLELNISAFKDRMDALAIRSPIKRVFTELRIGVTKDWEATGFFSKDVWFRGVIDLIIQLEDGCILIIDHKTGGGLGSLRPYEDQLNSYKILFHYGISPIKGAQSYIHFIQAGEIKSSYFSNAQEIEGKLRTTLDFDVEGAIDAVKEIGYWKHIASSSCKWCDYAAVCKSEGKLLKPVEASTRRFFEIKPV